LKIIRFGGLQNLFICIKGATLCIFYNENISVLTDYTIKTHCDTMHASQLKDITEPVEREQHISLSNPSWSTAKIIEKFNLATRYCSTYFPKFQ
jgi:hypothetical protein